MQQLAFIQSEISNVYGGQHQPAPATPVHIPEGGEGGDEYEEEQRKRAASRKKKGQPAPGRNEGFLSGSVFDRAKLARNAAEGNGDEFNSPRGRGERDRHLRRRSRTSIRSPLRQQQQKPPHGDGLPRGEEK